MTTIHGVFSIRPEQSMVYIRFVMVFALLTSALILYSALYWPLKLVLLVLLLNQSRLEWATKNPCADIEELRALQNQWQLTFHDGKVDSFEKIIILIHNPLFALIQLTGFEKNKKLILFNDQISVSELKLLHVKAGINYTARAV